MNDECSELFVGFTRRVKNQRGTPKRPASFTSMKRGKACTMAKVKYMTSANET